MDKEEKTDTAKEEEQADAEAAEVTEEKTEETTDEQAQDTDSEIDYDAEIEAERKRGKPDPNKAKEAFKKREEKRKELETEEEEEKPLTRKDLDSVKEEVRKELKAESIAQTLAGSQKEAELIVAKWKNRSFPSDLSIEDQVQEVYGGMYAKKLIGERTEALRALKGRDNANKSGTGSFQDDKPSTEPKLSPQDAEAIKAAGFGWNGKTRQWEKKLPNGKVLVRDPKTKQVRMV